MRGEQEGKDNLPATREMPQDSQNHTPHWSQSQHKLTTSIMLAFDRFFSVFAQVAL